MFKVNNNKDTRRRSLTSSWFLYCLLWTYLGHYYGISTADFERWNTEWDLSGSFKKPESLRNLEKSNVWSLERLSRTWKFFYGDHWIVPKLKYFLIQPKRNRNLISGGWFLWPMLLFDTQLRHVLQSYTSKSFLSSSFWCLPIKAYEPEVYANDIVQLWDMHCACICWSNYSLDMLVVTKILLENFSKCCKIYQLHKKSSYEVISRNLEICITNIKQNFKIIPFLKNICSLVYQFKLISDIFKQEISYLLSMSSF